MAPAWKAIMSSFSIRACKQSSSHSKIFAQWTHFVYTGRATSSHSCISSTQLRRAPRVLIFRLQRLYLNYVARPCASAPRAARRRLLRCAVACGRNGSTPITLCATVTSSRDRTGSTSTLPCTVTTCHLAARALRQPRRAPWLLASDLSSSTTCRLVALALLYLCRASGRDVSPLDFSSVGHTGSHRALGHSVSRLDFVAA
jgi:hypothetical protein